MFRQGFDPWLRPVPVGVTGELYLAEVQLADGYIGLPALTAGRFVAHPNGSGDRVYRTGDLVRWTVTGELDYVGRIDDQVKIRGFRIELDDIRSVIEQHPAVSSAVVSTHTHPSDEKYLAAYYVGADGEIGSDSLRRWLLDRLPDYMVPTAFIALERFPTTPNGKLDRRALPAPDPLQSDSRGAAPATPTEDVFARIFREVLQLPADTSLSVVDDFFRLGGHSLSATRVVARAHAQFGAVITLRDVFAQPTIGGLATITDSVVGSAERPIGPAEVNVPEVIPASFGQQSLWLIEQLGGPASRYVVPTVLEVVGEFDVTAYTAAVRDVVSRHESLRTLLVEHEERLTQRIVPVDIAVRDVPIDIEDLSEGSAEAIADRIGAAVRAGFDLAADLPIRVAILRTGTDRWTVVLAIHHHAIDEWSTPVLLRDLSAAYTARSAGVIPAWPDATVRYAQYATWQRDILGDPSSETSALGGHLAYWRDTLADAPVESTITPDRPRPDVPTHRGEDLSFPIDADTATGLRRICEEQGPTLFMLAHAAVALTASTLGAGTDVVIGSPIGGRTEAGLEDVIGYFVNTLPFRHRLDPADTVRSLLDRTRRTILDGFAHQAAPFEEIVRVSSAARDSERPPIFQIMLGHVATEPTLQSDPSELRMTEVDSPAASLAAAKADLEIDIEDTGLEVIVHVTYATDLFDRGTVERFLGILERVFAGFMDNLDLAIAALDVLPAADRTAIAKWSVGTAGPHPDSTLDERIRHRIAASPDAVAVIDGAGRETTYRRLGEHVDAMARVLLERGVGRGDRVAVLLPRSLELVVTLVAVIRSGAAYVPIDPDYPSERVFRILEDADPRVVVAGDHAAAEHPELAALADADRLVTPTADPDPASEVVVPAPPGPADTAYVIFTSGTTGRPKGVVVSHRAILNLIDWRQSVFPIGSQDRVLQKTSVGFDVSVPEVFWPLTVGAVVRLIRQDGEKDPGYLAELLETERIGFVELVPTVVQAMLDAGFDPSRSQLRHLSVGGEAFPSALGRALAIGPVRVWNTYGPTEAAVEVTGHFLESATPDSAALDSVTQWDGPVVPIGRPNTNTDVHVLDTWLRPVPIGAAGELYIGGVQLADSYIGRPGLTAGRFVPDPAGAGTRLYRTGDVVRWLPAGTLAFIGRADDQVKIRGFRIEPDDVRATLERHPGLGAAVVVALEHPAGRYLAAYYTAVDPTVTGDELREWVADRLPHYLVPTAFVALDAFPTTSNGKLDRRALPAPDPLSHDSGRAAETATEIAIADIFRDLLSVPDITSADANFFHLGGHSLLATRLVARSNAQFGTGLSLRDVFDTPTIAGLAGVIDTTAPAVRSRIADVLVPSIVPASFGQQALWVIEQLDGPGSRYVVPTVLDLVGDLHVPGMIAAIEGLIARHETLRTLLIDRDGTLEARVLTVQHAHELLSIDIDDLRDAAADVIDDRIASTIRTGFDLGRDIPIRAAILRTGPARWVLVLAFHHHAVDDWSTPALLDDLAAGYRAGIGEGDPSWAPLPVRYSQFAVWQRHILGDPNDAGSPMAEHLDYWRTVLDGAPDESTIASARPRPVSPSHAGADLDFDVDHATVAQLRALAADLDVSMFMICHAAVAVTASVLGAGFDVVIGSPVGGRTEDGLEDLVGYFVNTLPIRHRLSPNDTWPAAVISDGGPS